MSWFKTFWVEIVEKTWTFWTGLMTLLESNRFSSQPRAGGCWYWSFWPQGQWRFVLTLVPHKWTGHQLAEQNRPNKGVFTKCWRAFSGCAFTISRNIMNSEGKTGSCFYKNKHIIVFLPNSNELFLLKKRLKHVRHKAPWATPAAYLSESTAVWADLFWIGQTMPRSSVSLVDHAVI